MVIVNSNLHKGTKFYKEFPNKIQTVKKELSEKQKLNKEIMKLAVQRAWKMYHRGKDAFIKKEYTDKGCRAMDFEVQEYFKICLKKSLKTTRAKHLGKTPEKPEIAEAVQLEKLKVRKTRMNDEARQIIEAFNQTGQIASKALRKKSWVKNQKGQSSLFESKNNSINNNQLNLF